MAADSVYGGEEVQTAGRRAGTGYVLGVPSAQLFWSSSPQGPISNTAQQRAEALPACHYVRLSAGDRTKRPRLYEWAYLELAEVAADLADARARATVWTARLLIRRRLGDGELASFLTLPHTPSAGHHLGGAGRGRGAALGHRGRLRPKPSWP